MTEPPANPMSELELQRRWAESRWPTPFLRTDAGHVIRVISPGRWNHGPGPDFRGAQILDSDGLARRGDVELHLEPRAWLQHGHADDPAYGRVLLHVVERSRAGDDVDPRIPEASRLPPAMSSPISAATADAGPSPPCVDIVQRAGASAVDAQLQQIAQRRFLRKVRELQSMPIPPGPGSDADRRALLAAARALGQPHNAELALRAISQALDGRERWDDVQLSGDDAAWAGWRRGRGALGSAAGLSLVLTTLLKRWTADPLTPSLAFARLAALALNDATGELRIAHRLGRGRAIQLLADAVYPLTQSWSRWIALPGARYLRTDDLRDRLDDGFGDRAGWTGWRHPHTQALLELEQTRCRQWACRICPLAAVGLSSRSGREHRRT